MFVALAAFIAILWTGLGSDFRDDNGNSKKWSELDNPVPLVKLNNNNRPVSLVPLVKNFYKAIVNINTILVTGEIEGFGGQYRSNRGEKEEKGTPYDDLLENFDGNDKGKYYKRVNLGSGFVIHPEGYILTNNHVIREATKIDVTFYDSKVYEAQIVGRDADNDIALLKISSDKEFPFVPLGNSDILNVGEWVVAIGNPYGLSHSVTAGIVSAKGRIIGLDPVHTFIQTDASINPGNSGGPLFNINGEVIGINTAIIANGTGIGFAIPVSRVKRVISKIIPSVSTKQSWLGIRIQPVDKLMSKSLGLSKEYGVLVGDVVLGSPAERSGIKTGDIITGFAGIKIDTCRNLYSQIEKSLPNEEKEIDVLRGIEKKRFEVTPEEISRRFIIRSSTDMTNLLGVTVENLPVGYIRAGERKIAGVKVKSVEEGGIGYRAMVSEGDIIVELNRREVVDENSFYEIMSDSPKENNFLFLIFRDGKTFYAYASRKG